MYVQFKDVAATAIIAVFSCAQDPAIYPNQATIDSTDSRYKAYFLSLPSAAQATLPQPQ